METKQKRIGDVISKNKNLLTKERYSNSEIFKWINEEDENFPQELMELSSNADGCCDALTKATIISKSIRIEDMLNIIRNEKPVWHITSLFDTKISYRYSCRFPDRKGEKSAWSGGVYTDEDKRIISGLAQIKDEEHDSIRLIPNSPPIIPEKIKKLGKSLKEGYGLVPYILYKPDSWQEVKPDPALVCNVLEDWRVFAVWGDIVEQAEIITFMEMKK